MRSSCESSPPLPLSSASRAARDAADAAAIRADSGQRGHSGTAAATAAHDSHVRGLHQRADAALCLLAPARCLRIPRPPCVSAPLTFLFCLRSARCRCVGFGRTSEQGGFGCGQHWIVVGRGGSRGAGGRGGGGGVDGTSSAAGARGGRHRDGCAVSKAAESSLKVKRG